VIPMNPTSLAQKRMRRDLMGFPSTAPVVVDYVGSVPVCFCYSFDHHNYVDDDYNDDYNDDYGDDYDEDDDAEDKDESPLSQQQLHRC
jgi:hypothetical protein